MRRLKRGSAFRCSTFSNRGLLFFCLLLSSVLWADRLPERPRSYVTDLAGVLETRSKAILESVLLDLDRKAHAQVAVVVISSLDGNDAGDFANRLFEKWRIGDKKTNRGVLFLTAVQDKKTRVEVGYGLEGLIPDSKAGRLLDQYVIPAFQAGEMEKGITQGSLAIAQVIAEDAGVRLSARLPSRGRAPVRRKATLFEKLIGLLFLIILIPIVIRHPWILFFLLMGGRGGGGFGGGGFGGGFGGFGGGMSGGGGAGRSW